MRQEEEFVLSALRMFLLETTCL